MTTPVIQLKNVTKHYGDLAAVDQVSLSIDAGELVVLLGQSGCGKTSTLRLIAGLERPDSGEIWLDGKLAAGGSTWLPPEQRRIGMVFQDYALFPHLTLAGNIAFALNKLNGSERKQRVDEMLALVGLSDAADRFPHQISGGQQQRVALARALAPKPSVVLLDEPFSNLDAALRKEMREEVRRILRAAGTTAIFVTHDQQEALSFSDRVAMLRSGKLLQFDSPQDIYENPTSLTVASFIGEANFISASASGTQATSALGAVTLREPANGTVTLLIRPETIRLAENGGVPARVDWREFYGHDQRVGLMLSDGTRAAARFSARYHFTIGDTIQVYVEGAVKAYNAP